MGYSTFKEASKTLIKSEDIGSGQIELSHLSPSLFVELRQVALHTHTGVRSRQVNLKDLTGAFTSKGFYMYSSDATKKYQVTINSGTGAFVLTQV
ncbi:hypothetical protein HZB78_06410 [Candidatus Collierbacteria bacterium]|nr:hypothetical protein [Candidatus Collierbacteria bacterium]